jgi:hypothetical protein
LRRVSAGRQVAADLNRSHISVGNTVTGGGLFGADALMGRGADTALAACPTAGRTGRNLRVIRCSVLI